ncbi:uncharacterized protein LOC134684721 isoform X1 [Mytilus trossulus]|uniref:uncharacterized protein LOC134684721 isoform X1 n=1 Tax=Mytilus trossulus TaxID=6551 RepID=UPI0030075DD1
MKIYRKTADRQSYFFVYQYFRMGFGASKQVVISAAANENVARLSAILFSKDDAESVLRFEPMGTYLLYRDYESDRMYLSLRSENYVEHHRINYEDNLYYMDNQPYPYLDSIVRYHQRHKLNGTRLKHQAHLSARTVKLFTTKITAQNGNFPLDRKSKSESDITDNNNVIGIEHKNDVLVGKSRISKSSGRLWISGIHKSLKRMSAPERNIPFSGSGIYHRDPRPNTFTENGYIPHIDEGDNLDDIIEDLQDFHQSLNSSPRTDNSSPRTDNSSPRTANSYSDIKTDSRATYKQIAGPGDERRFDVTTAFGFGRTSFTTNIKLPDTPAQKRQFSDTGNKSPVKEVLPAEHVQHTENNENSNILFCSHL